MATSTKRKATAREKTPLRRKAGEAAATSNTTQAAGTAKPGFTLVRSRKADGAEPKERKSLRERADGTVSAARSHPRTLIALVVLVVVVAMLYAPVRDYYVARRTGEDLQAYYEAVEAQNGELTEDIHRLQTRDGVEDEAREHGLVYPDETSVVVEGYTDTVNTPLPEVVLEDTRPWYVRALDFVFGYEFGTWQ